MRNLWFACLIGLSACAPAIEADTLIINGKVFTGEKSGEGQYINLAISEGKIVFLGEKRTVRAKTIVDAQGLYVLPGFIDPHTHSFSDLISDDPIKRRNDNYLFQGVTTVINGNDGFGEPNIAEQMSDLDETPIGTNTALFIGHGALRQTVMGGKDSAPSKDELATMVETIGQGMEAGALGLSTGLFYAPGSFSDTEEVIALAREAGRYGGVYDSHIRDEANYSIGLIPAIEEVIQIAEEAEIRANIAHIKALGTDVWGQSDQIIRLVEAAQRRGLSMTADQYPWRASGTRVSNALLPRWVKAGDQTSYMARLNDSELRAQILSETAENLRRRGGPSSILITSTLSSQGDTDWVGKTLGEIAAKTEFTPIEMAIQIAQLGDARIASFNMNPEDMRRFMEQSWVMTSSDGSTGHPRKYASYPKKYQEYVVNQKWLPFEDFVYRSAGLVADTFNLCNRGYLRIGYEADITLIDPDAFAPKADFQNPAVLSTGVRHVFVNGRPAISDGVATDIFAGQALRRCNSEGADNAE
jgi:N-acyl-D-aspartate/D-glutamate deacylase